MYSICLNLLRLQFILQGEEKKLYKTCQDISQSYLMAVLPCMAFFIGSLFFRKNKSNKLFFTTIFILFIFFLTLATVVN